LQQLRKELQLRKEFQFESPSVRGAGFAAAERRYALGRSHLVAGSIVAMRLRSHTQEALSQEFPRNSSDNLGFLRPKEHEASLAWSYQLFSRIQIGLVPNQFGKVPCGFLTLDTWARQSLPVVIVSLATSGAVARLSAMMSDIGIPDKLLVNYSSTEFGWAKWISTKLTEVAAWNAVFEAT
jgi:hypothetical protein